MSYAKRTKTSAEVTQAEIQTTLRRFGANGFMSGQQQLADGTEARASILSGEWIGSADEAMIKTPKKSAGRLLDGREWNEFPNA